MINRAGRWVERCIDDTQPSFTTIDHHGHCLYPYLTLCCRYDEPVCIISGVHTHSLDLSLSLDQPMLPWSRCSTPPGDHTAYPCRVFSLCAPFPLYRRSIRCNAAASAAGALRPDPIRADSARPCLVPLRRQHSKIHYSVKGEGVSSQPMRSGRRPTADGRRRFIRLWKLVLSALLSQNMLCCMSSIT